MKLALLGAESCIGTRVVESFQLAEGPSVAAIARDASQLTRPARFTIDLRTADPFNVDSLARSFAGCSAALHAMAMEHPEAKQSVTMFCRAATQAGVRRLVYLSTIDVHGLPAPVNADEKTALHTRHLSERVNLLAAAERHFAAECRSQGLAGIVLRPGLIYGPRAEFIAQLAAEFQEQRAWLLNKGVGVCNCVYVDNVIAAIRQALRPKAASGTAYVVTDDETVTWHEFYETFCGDFGLVNHPVRQLIDTPSDTAECPPLRRPGAVVSRLPSPESSTPPREDLARRQSLWKFPTTRLKRELGVKEFVAFAEGMRRTAAWWRFAHGDFSAAA